MLMSCCIYHVINAGSSNLISTLNTRSDDKNNWKKKFILKVKVKKKVVEYAETETR